MPRKLINAEPIMYLLLLPSEGGYEQLNCWLCMLRILRQALRLYPPNSIYKIPIAMSPLILAVIWMSISRAILMWTFKLPATSSAAFLSSSKAGLSPRRPLVREPTLSSGLLLSSVLEGVLAFGLFRQSLAESDRDLGLHTQT